MQDLMQRYLDANKINSLECESGVRKMEKVMKEVCGYSNDWSGTMHNFFADNPGAMEAVVEWISSQRVPEWKENLENLVGTTDDEDPVFDISEAGDPPDEETGFSLFGGLQ